MNIKVSYFQIAGFIIKFVFYPCSSFLNTQDNTQIFIEEAFQEFLLEEINKKYFKADYTIEFHHREMFNMLFKDKGQYLLISEGNKRKVKTFYDISFAQLTNLLTRVVNELLALDGFIIHSSAICKNNLAYLFLGQSGAGKSTIISLLKKKYTPLADDSVIIRKKQNKFFLYQIPVKEKPDFIYKSKNKYAIKKIYFLKKSKELKVEKIKNKEKILTKIMRQFWIEKPNKNQVKLMLDFIAKNDFYFLYFPKNETLVNNLFTKE